MRSAGRGRGRGYRRLRELNGRGVEFYWPCLVPHVIAMRDASSGRWDDATTYFEKALSLARHRAVTAQRLFFGLGHWHRRPYNVAH